MAFDGWDEAADADAVDEEGYGFILDVGEESVEGVLGSYVDGVGFYVCLGLLMGGFVDGGAVDGYYVGFGVFGVGVEEGLADA